MRPQRYDEVMSPNLVQRCPKCQVPLEVLAIIPIRRGLDDVRYRCRRCGNDRKMVIEWGQPAVSTKPEPTPRSR